MVGIDVDKVTSVQDVFSPLRYKMDLLICNAD